MKFTAILCFLVLSSCVKQTVHPPVGGVLSEQDMSDSKNRVKNLNQLERDQIATWITLQDKEFYPTSLNYWISVKDLENRTRKSDGVIVSYEYDLYDFDQVKLYDTPKIFSKVKLGTYQDLKAVEHALRYLNPGEEVTILSPSALAFGTYGDNDKIPNDMPVIIHLKVYNAL